MAFLSKDAIGVVLEILLYCNVWYVHPPGRAGAVRVAGLQTGRKRVLRECCAEEMDCKITLDDRGRKVGQELLMPYFYGDHPSIPRYPRCGCVDSLNLPRRF